MFGPAVGRAYHPNAGMGTVYADFPGSDRLTLVTDKCGRRYLVRRENLQWRRV